MLRPRPLLGLVLLLAPACSVGLTAIGRDDTGIDVATPDDSGVGEPLDTAGDNAPPEADAGPDQTGTVGSVVQLDGSASRDPDDDPLTFAWTFLERPPSSSATLINDTRPDPQFWADRDGTYRIGLTVSDGARSDSDEVTVTVETPNDRPVANAGTDQSVAVGDLVQLNGSASSDPDGDPLDFRWSMVSRPSGSGASLSDPTSAMPRFTADTAGTYRIQLVVHDGTADSAGDEVQVIATSADDGDCLSCAAQARHALRTRLGTGNAASGPGLVLLPLLVLLWQRKRS